MNESDLLSTPAQAQDLTGEAPLSMEALHALRLKIVREDYDPSPEEMAAAVQSICRANRTKDSIPKEKPARSRRSAKAEPAVSLDEFLS